ncbi:hypothetical protein RGQ29_032456, partial [Quercus rubra]
NRVKVQSLHHPAGGGGDPQSIQYPPLRNYPLYRIPSAKKAAGTFESLATDSGKNDYDWLKTPPATPLFPSLEMEATAPELVLQKELPITRPPSRAGTKDKQWKTKSKSSTSKSKSPKLPLRSTTPSQRPTISSTQSTKTTKVTPIVSQKLAPNISSNKQTNATTTPSKSTSQMKIQNDHNKDFLTSNLSKNIRLDSKPKPRSRCVSPLVRSTIPAQISDFSNETHNLRTDRSTLVTRGRLVNNNPVQQKPEHNPKPRRQSCSPSVMRGRIKGRFQTRNSTSVLGSRMVEKMMNARKLGAEERESKPKSRGFVNESSGFGRMLSKSSLDMALKHMIRITTNLYHGIILSHNESFE